MKARVIDLPYKGTENAKEIIKLDPYVMAVKTKDDVVEDKKKKKKVVEVEEKKKRAYENFEKVDDIKYSNLPKKLMIYDTNELDDTDSDEDLSFFLIVAPNQCLTLLHEII